MQKDSEFLWKRWELFILIGAWIMIVGKDEAGQRRL